MGATSRDSVPRSHMLTTERSDFNWVPIRLIRDPFPWVPVAWERKTPRQLHLLVDVKIAGVRFSNGRTTSDGSAFAVECTLIRQDSVVMMFE